MLTSSGRMRKAGEPSPQRGHVSKVQMPNSAGLIGQKEKPPKSEKSVKSEKPPRADQKEAAAAEAKAARAAKDKARREAAAAQRAAEQREAERREQQQARAEAAAAALEVGSVMQARDSEGRWYKATVIESRGFGRSRELKVHFKRFASKWDEWIAVSAGRLRPYGVPSPPRPEGPTAAGGKAPTSALVPAAGEMEDGAFDEGEPMQVDFDEVGPSAGGSAPRTAPPNGKKRASAAPASRTAAAAEPPRKRAAAAKATRSNVDGWAGEPISRALNGDIFYDKVRKAGVEFHVHDFVLVCLDLQHQNDFDKQQICQIDAMWEDVHGKRWFEGRWYYRPDETACGRLPGHDPREVFESADADENEIDTINTHCVVMEWDKYQSWLDEPALEDEDDKTTFACRAVYHPGSGEFVPLKGASSMAEVVRVSRSAALGAGFGGLGASPALGGPSSAAGAAGSSSYPHGKAMPGSAAPITTTLLAGGRRRNLCRFAEAAARLTPHAQPERMPCRERERAEVVGALRAAILEGTLGGSLYLSGTPGTGKTATVHQALRELAADKSLPNFRAIQINGMKLASPYEVYSLLWESLTGQGAKPGRALELLERRFSAESKSTVGSGQQRYKRKIVEKAVVVLDELDYLVTRKQSVIYNLFEWAARPDSALIVTGISNTMDLPERLLPRVESRLNIRRVAFNPYSFPQIVTIIEDRLGGLTAFDPSDGGLELCARRVASVSGDVRRALEICRLACQIAEREEVEAAGREGGVPPTHVTGEHVIAAQKQLRGSSVVKVLKAVPLQQKLVRRDQDSTPYLGEVDL